MSRTPRTRPAVLATGVALALTLTACGEDTGSGTTTDAPAVASPSASAEASASPTADATASPSSTAAPSAEPTGGVEAAADGTVTTTDGSVTVTIPPGWTDRTAQLQPIAQAQGLEAAVEGGSSSLVLGLGPEAGGGPNNGFGVMVVRATPEQPIDAIIGDTGGLTMLADETREIAGEPARMVKADHQGETTNAATEMAAVNHGGASYVVVVLDAPPGPAFSPELTGLLDSWVWTD